MFLTSPLTDMTTLNWWKSSWYRLDKRLGGPACRHGYNYEEKTPWPLRWWGKMEKQFKISNIPRYFVFYSHYTLQITSLFSRCVCINHEKRLVASSCLHVSIWLPLERLREISCPKIQMLLKSDKHIGDFTWRPKYACITDGSTEYYVAWQQWTGNPLLHFHCNSTVLHCWQRHASQQQKGNVLLHFHGNNGHVNAPQCYIIHTLPILLCTRSMQVTFMFKRHSILPVSFFELFRILLMTTQIFYSV